VAGITGNMGDVWSARAREGGNGAAHVAQDAMDARPAGWRGHRFLMSANARKVGR
jgi:hypothetical protein